MDEVIWKCNLLLLVLAMQICKFARGGTDPVLVTKTIVPGLPSNHNILALSQVMKRYFREYKTPVSHSLLKVAYKGPNFFATENVTDNFMRCNKPPEAKPYGYICLDHKRWVIKTTSDYDPSTIAQELVTLTIEVNGENSKGGNLSDIYNVKINILPRCTVQAIRYANMKSACAPRVTELTNSWRNENTFLYNLPSKDLEKTTKIYDIKFNVTGRFKFKVYCDDVFLNGVDVNVAETPHSLPVRRLCKKRTKVVKLKFDGLKDVSVWRTKINLTFYIMEDFCGNSGCMKQYRWWRRLIGKIPLEKRSCIEDPLWLIPSYEICLAPVNVTILPSSETTFYGAPLTLSCEPTNIFVPYKIHWKLIRNGFTKKSWQTKNKYYIIDKVTYDDDAFFQCTLVAGRTSTLSEKYRVKLRNIFTGEMQFRLKGVQYKKSYDDQRSAEYKKFKTFLEREIDNILDNKNSIYPNHPSFKIMLLQKEDKKIFVKGEVSMLRSEDKLKTWTYMKWMDYFTDIIKLRFTFSGIENIKILNEDVCLSISEHQNCSDVHYIWPSSFVGYVAKLPCFCNTTRFVYKRCSRESGRSYAKYEATNFTECDYRRSELERLSVLTVTLANARDISKRLTDASSEGDALTSKDVTLMTDTLEKFQGLLNTSTEVENNVMNSINDIMGLKDDLLKESEGEDKSTTRIITLLGDFAEELTSSTNMYTISRSNFALSGIKTPVEEFHGLSVGVAYNSEKGMAIHTGVGEEAYASASIPSSITKYLPKSMKDIKIVTITYNSDRMFVVDNSSSGKNFSVNSPVLSTEIRGSHISNLDEPITLSFKATNPELFSHQKMCVYWNFTEKAWSSEGCSLVKSDDVSNTVTCSCDHMTNFAVLFNAVPPEGIHGEILTYITYIGLCISIIGALLTLITYSLFPMLRNTIPPKILMNLCVALIAMKVSFLIGADATSSKIGCKTVSVILQYFFLSVFSWSAVEGFHSSRGLVFPMRVEINCFMQKAIVFGWGVPIIITAIGAGVWFDDYGGEKSCFVRGKPFFFTVLAPILIVIVFNMSCTCAIAGVLMSSSRKYKSQSMTMTNRVRIIMGLVVLLGVTWIFGFLVISNDILVFQYLFCVLCSTQGLYLFLLYGIRKEKHRQCWHKLLRGSSISEIQRTIVKRAQGSNSKSWSGDGTNTRDRFTSNSSISSTDRKAVSSIRIQLRNQSNYAEGDTGSQPKTQVSNNVNDSVSLLKKDHAQSET